MHRTASIAARFLGALALMLWFLAGTTSLSATVATMAPVAPSAASVAIPARVHEDVAAAIPPETTRAAARPGRALLIPSNELDLSGATARPLFAEPITWASGPGERRARPLPGLTWADSATDPPPIRSPKLSFLLSAIVPGAGQIYNGSHRGYAFLAVEAASWFFRVSNLDAADRKETDYRAFADRHWDFDRFVGSVNSEGCGFAPGADTLIAGYLATDLDQYYEELAKADDYRCGWDDAAFDPAAGEVRSERRVDYRDQREKSNTFRSRAGLALGIIVLNRVVSAVDAFRLAQGRQLGESPSLRLTGDLGADAAGPRAVFRLTKEFP